MEDNRPLVTFAIYAYNEEKYIAEAIESALAQTYRPLEIVLSDDCSRDATHEIMERFQRENTSDISIVVNRNPVNLGIGGQLNRICELSSGELIIMGGGDDRSLSERTAKIAEYWISHRDHAHSIYTSAKLIDAEGRLVGGRLAKAVGDVTLSEGINSRYHGVYGATQAFSRDVWRKFGPFHPKLKLEDNVILMRAQILGGFEYMDIDLVEYRIHADNSCRLSTEDVDMQAWVKQVTWQHRESMLAFTHFLWDLHGLAADRVAPEEFQRSVRLANYRMLNHAIAYEHYLPGTKINFLEHAKEIFGLTRNLLKTYVKSKISLIDRWNAHKGIKARLKSEY